MNAPSEILIAEDSATQTVKLRYLLETNGYAVRTTSNGARAIEAAREQKPTLIIADVDMPQMNGHEMCRAMKADPNLRDIPIILLTSLTDPSDVLRGLEAGADYYLTKPFQPDHLLSRVRETLANPPIDDNREPAPPIKIVVNGTSHVLTVNRRQVLGLLLSTYSDAVQRNTALIQSERELNRRNELLDQAVRSEREAHEELKKTQSQLIQAEKMVGLGQLVAGIAHEINNPLAFVINNAAIIQRELSILTQWLDLYKNAEAGLADRSDLLNPIVEFESQYELQSVIKDLPNILNRSRDGMDRIRQIISNLRDFVRLDENVFTEADLIAGIKSTLAIIRHKAETKQIQFELDLQPLPVVECYPAKINQVIMNLLSNAIDASPAGGTITIRTSVKNDDVRIDVIDNGAGIPADIRDKIFDPFFTTKPIGSGTGLGLSISYGIVRDHGGRIDVDSTTGKGSRFSIHLPRVPASAKDERLCA